MGNGELHAKTPSERGNRVLVWFRVAVLLLLLKTFLGILAEYRGYFPASFDSPFLAGRRYTFTGVYPAAFYLHIVSGPICLVLAAVQIWTSQRGSRRWRSLHRRLGKWLTALILLVMLPSGLVMSARAYGGHLSAAGFAVQTLATAFTVVLAARSAIRGDLRSHQAWAGRCFVLLVSPLILRLVSGVLITLDCETTATYQINAWTSWLIPLVLFEFYQAFSNTPAPSSLPAPLLSSAGTLSCVSRKT